MHRIRLWLSRIGMALLVILLGAPLLSFGLAQWREDVPAGREGRPGSYVKVGDLDLHYVSWGPEKGPVILLVHGTIAWSETWTPVAERLAKDGFHVLAPDFPPFGYSSHPESGDYSRQALATRIIGFADAMKFENFVLAGHSFGGGGTVEAAFRHPDRISGLILLDPALRLSTPSPAAPLGQLIALPVIGDGVIAATFTNPLTTGFGLRSFIRDPAVATDARVALYRQPLFVKGATSAVRSWYLTGLYGDERNAMSADVENYRRFANPVLLVWGREDTVTPLAQGEEIARLLPNARLETLADVNHIPQIEMPERTANLISAFAAKAAWRLRL